MVIKVEKKISEEKKVFYENLLSQIAEYLDAVEKGDENLQTTLISSIVDFDKDEINKLRREGRKLGEDQVVTDKIWIDKQSQAYSMAFFGFNSSVSEEFQSQTFGSKINDDTTYAKVVSTIAANTTKFNCFKYHINDENWLRTKLEEVTKMKVGTDEYNEAMLQLPEVIICPADVMFSSDVTKMLVDLNIKVQLVSTKKQENSLCIGEIVHTTQRTDQVIDIDNSFFKNSMDQIEDIVINSKMNKNRLIYRAKLEEVQKRVDMYGISDIETHGQLFIRENNSLIPIDMNINSISPDMELYDYKGERVNVSALDIERVERKMDGILNHVIKLYQEKDIATYNHINGMINLIPIINGGLPEGEKLTEIEMKELKRMVILHDIGKLVIPSQVLDKNGMLSDKERSVMNSHVYLENVCLANNEFMNTILDSALLHHSKGRRGYKDSNLNFVENNRLVDMLPVLDVYDALTGVRPYKAPKPLDVTMDIMEGDIKNGALSNEYYNALINGLEISGVKIPERNKEDTNVKIA